MVFLWNPDLDALRIGGIAVGWYGLLFALGFLLSQRVMIFVYHREKKPELDVLLPYLIVGTVVGARLGHCLFYDPGYFLTHPLDMLKVWEGGLASHGAVAGLIGALFVFSKRHPEHRFSWLLDRIAIVALMTGALVRLGNFINGEIIGTPTRADAGVVFAGDAVRAIDQEFPKVSVVSVERKDTDPLSAPGLVPMMILLDISLPGISRGGAESALRGEVLPAIFRNPAVARSFVAPDGAVAEWALTPLPGGVRAQCAVLGIVRHPVQLYEGAIALLLAILFFRWWWKKTSALPGGLVIGWCLALLFSSRFLLEFLKEEVAPLETGLPLKMGQLLSLPCIALGIWIVLQVRRRGQHEFSRHVGGNRSLTHGTRRSDEEK